MMKTQELSHKLSFTIYTKLCTDIPFFPLGCTNGSPGQNMTQFQNQFTRETTPWVQKGPLGGQNDMLVNGKLVTEK